LAHPEHAAAFQAARASTNTSPSEREAARNQPAGQSALKTRR
jgi:hypothetical protein